MNHFLRRVARSLILLLAATSVSACHFHPNAFCYGRGLRFAPSYGHHHHSNFSFGRCAPIRRCR